MTHNNQTLMKHLLIVEDNPIYRNAAQQYVAEQDIRASYAEDHDQAQNLLLGIEDSIDAAIIDCFFPKATSNKDIELGERAVRMMVAMDPRGRRSTPIAKALTQVGNLLGRGFAKIAAKNAGIQYASHVDQYWAIESAMKESPQNQPLGILIAEQAEQRGIPFVLATSTYHHDELTQPIADFAGRRGWTLVDCTKPEEKATIAFWERAFRALNKRSEE